MLSSYWCVTNKLVSSQRKHRLWTNDFFPTSKVVALRQKRCGGSGKCTGCAGRGWYTYHNYYSATDYLDNCAVCNGAGKVWGMLRARRSYYWSLKYPSVLPVLAGRSSAACATCTRTALCVVLLFLRGGFLVGFEEGLLHVGGGRARCCENSVREGCCDLCGKSYSDKDFAIS